MNIQDAWKIWAQPQNPPQAAPQAETKEYTAERQLFDGLQWEVLEHPLATIQEKLQAAQIMERLTGAKRQ